MFRSLDLVRHMLFSVLLAVRLAGAYLAPIMDCDETFNYLETWLCLEPKRNYIILSNTYHVGYKI